MVRFLANPVSKFYSERHNPKIVYVPATPRLTADW